jgi:Ca-activated chloride channel homolog
MVININVNIKGVAMRFLLKFLGSLTVTLSLLTGCGRETGTPGITPMSDTPIHIGSGSENALFFPAIKAFAKKEGFDVKFTAKGSVDLANDLSQGKDTPYDIAWLASSGVLDTTKGHAVKNATSVMISPVMPIVKRSKAEELGWTKKEITNGDFYQAVTQGKIRFGMTSASQSFSGLAAYLGMVSSLSGNPEVLTSQDLSTKGLPDKIKPILNQVARSSGSSGFLKDFMVANVSTYDAMLNYEGLAFEANQALQKSGSKEVFCALMPVDGVVVADHPIGYVDKGNPKKAEFFKKLVAHLKSPEFKQILKDNGRRSEMGLLTTLEKTTYDPCWDTARPIKVVTMPSPEVVLAAVDLYQGVFRKPSFTVYVGDFSGSMKGDGVKALKASMRTLYDPASSKQYGLQPTAKDVSIFIPFSGHVWGAIESHGNQSASYEVALKQIESLEVNGGTQIYLGVKAALDRIELEKKLSDYAVSIILMTDGESAAESKDLVMNRLITAFKKQNVTIYSILFGAANPDQLKELARHQINGNEDLMKSFVCDGRTDLVGCFRKIRANN